MAFSVLLTDLVEIPVDVLTRAFRSLPELTDLDAARRARDVCGVVAKGLSEDAAAVLRSALGRAGVEAVVVPEEDLLRLPTARSVSRMDCSAEQLVVHEQLAGPKDISWDHVRLLAAGRVRCAEFKRIVEHRSGNSDSIESRMRPADVTHRETASWLLLLEIYLDVEPGRYDMRADRFCFFGLGDRETTVTERNFALLVRDMIRFAPGAVLNMGARILKDDEYATFEYPTRQAFEEEIVWSFWRHL